MTAAVCGACRQSVSRTRLRVLVDQNGEGGRVLALCPACSPRYDRSHQYQPTNWPPTGLSARQAAQFTLTGWSA